ncbi:unnamed protein product [Larinioides sclopetarius]|uniref:Polynucleotide 5'-hydroxyl-kinase NOL9 n=1 Tax=Larinioides sclopetarius TaxID=280406 RepID=A0AAV2AIQ4_9ARAC
MVKRKQKQSQKSSDDEIESRTPARQSKKLKKSRTEISAKNISSSKKRHDSGDSDISNLGETSGSAANDTKYEDFTSFLKAFSYSFENSEEHSKSKGVSGNTSNECENSMIDSKKEKSHEEVPHPASSSHDNVLNEELETNIRILSVPSKLSEIVLLQHPASVTLHGYVKVAVWCGSIHILGYNVKEGENIFVFSTEGTGLKKIVTSRPKHKLDIEVLEKGLEKLTCLEKNLNLEAFMDDVGPLSVIICVEKVLLPVPLRVLELYYPTALQTRWIRSETSEKENNLKLCSTEQAYTIDLKGDYKMLSRQVNEAIGNPDNTEFGPRILVRGEKNMGKSTLIRYLMNSSLNKVDEVYFLDTDPGQTEYTPPGVVSLLRVTRPLLGPTFAHQKKPLKMIFIGSVTPGTCPTLYEESVKQLIKYFNEKILKIGGKTQKMDEKIQKKALFVNTIGWVQGVGELCLQNVKRAVKPTMEIELVAPDSNPALTKEVDESGITIFKIPSKAPSRESGAPSYSPVEMRNFNIMAYFGLFQKSFLPQTMINSFHPVCVGWDKIALYVMGKKVPAHRLIEAIHCSIVALCRVNLSSVLKSDNPDFPMTLTDEPICECLGFGLVRASDEINRLFYIITPLTLDELENVNALVKGNIMIPDEIFLKQLLVVLLVVKETSWLLLKSPY